MIAYSEEKIGRRIDYVKHILDEDGNNISVRHARIRLHQNRGEDGGVRFVLYDDRMEPIHEAYAYLNSFIGASPLTTRTKAAHALRLLYQFLSLTNRGIEDIDGQALSELEGFLRGASGGLRRLGIVTQRSAETVNGYYSVYRSFCNFLNIECAPLQRAAVSRVSASVAGDYESSIDRKRYKANLATRNRSGDIPLYISPDEFQRLYQAADQTNDKQAMLIMRLMYAYGMRIGEVLGLTIEDIAEIDAHGSLVPVLYLRNRASDRKYQYAKNLPHVADRAQYGSRDYKGLTTTLSITYDTFERLVDYANEAHEAAELRYPESYASSVADKVSNSLPESSRNHYLFLNRYGKVLSDQVWNNHLHAYFAKAGIPTDEGVKQTNLSHRFRHGFAMLHAQFLPEGKRADALHLQRLMRHKSIASTMVYYNPTLEDEHRVKLEFQEELYRMIPELGCDA